VGSVFRDEERGRGDLAVTRLGVTPKRIVRLDEADNFLVRVLLVPAGPCSDSTTD